jgi:hypothetical protein
MVPLPPDLLNRDSNGKFDINWKKQHYRIWTKKGAFTRIWRLLGKRK